MAYRRSRGDGPIKFRTTFRNTIWDVMRKRGWKETDRCVRVVELGATSAPRDIREFTFENGCVIVVPAAAASWTGISTGPIASGCTMFSTASTWTTGSARTTTGTAGR